MYDVAIDLGTTTIAASLLDSGTGERLAVTVAMNSQRQYGFDVVSRLAAGVTSSETRHTLALLVREQLRNLIIDLTDRAEIDLSRVGRIAIAGNPAMQHLFLELPLETLAFPPYRPHFTEGSFYPAAKFGWSGESEVYLFPMPGGFVGGDTVAFLYGEAGSGNRFTDCSGPSLYLDLGTNGEIVLADRTTLWATSAAAGMRACAKPASRRLGTCSCPRRATGRRCSNRTRHCS